MAKGSKVIDLFNNIHVETNDHKKYSVAIKTLIEQFKNNFTEDYYEEDILEFTINAWNMAIMKRVVPAKEFKAIIADNDRLTKNDITVLNQMIKYKDKHYGAFDRFVKDYELIGEEDNLQLVVITREKEEFIMDMMLALDDFEEDMNYMDMESNDEEEAFINRSALMLTPKLPFKEWLNSLSKDYEESEIRESNTYLLDETIEDLDKWLQKKFDVFFKMELAEWHPIKKDWPMKRTYKMFEEWFVVSWSTSVYDMVREPIFKDI